MQDFVEDDGAKNKDGNDSSDPGEGLGVPDDNLNDVPFDRINAGYGNEEAPPSPLLPPPRSRRQSARIPSPPNQPELRKSARIRLLAATKAATNQQQERSILRASRKEQPAARKEQPAARAAREEQPAARAAREEQPKKQLAARAAREEQPKKQPAARKEQPKKQPASLSAGDKSTRGGGSAAAGPSASGARVGLRTVPRKSQAHPLLILLPPCQIHFRVTEKCDGTCAGRRLTSEEVAKLGPSKARQWYNVFVGLRGNDQVAVYGDILWEIIKSTPEHKKLVNLQNVYDKNGLD